MAPGITFRPSRGDAEEPPPGEFFFRPPHDEECDTMLIVEIYRAEDIDKSTKNLNVGQRNYTVFGFVDAPSNEFQTELKRGLPNPQWLEKLTMNLGKYQPCKFLHLEVTRVSRSKKDPGNSKGIEVVGRTKIPLPEIGQKVGGRYGLVTTEEGCTSGQPGGHIVVNIEMKARRRKRNFYNLH